MKDEYKKIINFGIFILIANLPFFAITNMVGIDTFLDSFENPDRYIFFRKTNSITNTKLEKNTILVIQKTYDTNTEILEGDQILYYKDSGEIDCKKVYSINCIGPLKKYHIVDNNNHFTGEKIYNQQIIGKVLEISDSNIITELSLKIWDISIHEFNILDMI